VSKRTCADALWEGKIAEPLSSRARGDLAYKAPETINPLALIACYEATVRAIEDRHAALREGVEAMECRCWTGRASNVTCQRCALLAADDAREAS